MQMDKISCITKGVKKYIQTLYAFSNKQGLNATYTILDGIWSYIKYGCVLNQYVDGCFYKRKYFERKNMLTYKRWCDIVKRYNHTDDIKILQNKVEFNKYFKDFIKRNWINPQVVTFEEFDDFMRGNSEVIIKPLDGWEGVGVRAWKMGDSNGVRQLFNQLHTKSLLVE